MHQNDTASDILNFIGKECTVSEIRNKNFFPLYGRQTLSLYVLIDLIISVSCDDAGSQG